jgi:c-di-GMP-related signal transduction protein
MYKYNLKTSSRQVVGTKGYKSPIGAFRAAKKQALKDILSASSIVKVQIKQGRSTVKEFHGTASELVTVGPSKLLK